MLEIVRGFNSGIQLVIVECPDGNYRNLISFIQVYFILELVIVVCR